MKTSYRRIYRVIFFSLAVFCFQQSQAQILKKIKDRVKETTEDNITDDAGNATNNAIDNAENSLKKKNKKQKNNKDADGNNASANDASQSISAYQNYDFVPGDTVLFSDDFADDMDGEFPVHWDLTKGQAVVYTIAGRKAFLLTDGNYCQVLPRMKTASYLGNAFTIEFDTYTDGNGDESPSLLLNYVDKDGNDAYGEIGFARGDDLGRGEVDISGFPHDGLSASFPESLIKNYSNQWHHCAIAYKNGQLKVYVDQFRILTQPSLGCTPTSFWMGGVGDQNHPIVITNIRLASGGSMNMIGKKFTEAKIITHGITFDIDKSDIKPQSMGTLNMIVGVLKSNPDLKFEIDGHTDNTGETAHNLTLSQQRADAVKAQLIKMGIDAGRLTTKGFGDTKPISDNDTPEGRANNRRVEFVKI